MRYGEPNAISNAIGYAKFYSRSHDGSDSRLRGGGQRDRDAQAQGRVQRAIGVRHLNELGHDSVGHCDFINVVRL
jgi:hypothetical protein